MHEAGLWVVDLSVIPQEYSGAGQYAAVSPTIAASEPLRCRWFFLAQSIAAIRKRDNTGIFKVESSNPLEGNPLLPDQQTKF